MKSILVLLFISFSLSLHAQSSDQGGFERKGFLLCAAFGVSSIQLSTPGLPGENQLGLSLPNLKIGTMIGRRTAALIYLPGTVYSYDLEGRKRDRGFEGIVPSVQFWAADRLWLLGGVGLGMDAPAFDIYKPQRAK